MTATCYLEHTEWAERIVNGEYLDYCRQMYG